MLPRRVFLVSTVVGVALLGDSLLYVALPVQGPELGLSLPLVGILLSVNRFVRPFVNSLDVRLYTRVGVSRPFAFATALAALTTGAYALVPLFWPLLLARMLWGIAWSLLRLGAYLTVLEDGRPERRARLFGAYNGLARTGSLVAVVLGGFLVDQIGFRSTVLLFAVLSLFGLGLAWAGSRSVSGGVPAREMGGPATLDRRAIVLCRPAAVLLIGFAYSFVLSGVVTVTVGLLLEARLGDTSRLVTLTGLVLAVRWISDIGFAPLAGLVSDRIGRVRALPAVALLAATLVASITLVQPLALSIGLIALVFLAGTVLQLNGEAAAGDLTVAQRSNAMLGRYATAVDLGAATGPLVALPLTATIGLTPTYLVGAALLAGSGLLALKRVAAVAYAGTTPVLGSRGMAGGGEPG